MFLEVCANSFTSAQIAQDAGADRIELCKNLAVGGVTPSYGTIKKVVQELTIPSHILIRPRDGDFVYNNKEVQQMLDSIAFCKELGCKGIVSGALLKNGTLDIKTTQLLKKASEGMEFTFHRAFDVCTNPGTALFHLIDMNVTRLLTSGQKTTAIEGLKFLKSLKEIAKDKLQIMPGGGITSNNAVAFKKANFKMIHFSAIKKDSHTTSLFNNNVSGFSDLEEIKKIKSVVQP